MKTTRQARFSFHANTLNIELPKKWQDLSEDNIRFIFRLFLLGQSDMQIRLNTFLRLTGAKVIGLTDPQSWLIRLKTEKKKLFVCWHTWQLQSFCKQLDFITSHDFDMPVFLPINQHDPDPLLSDITFQQYLIAENYYQAYISTKNEKYLHSLAGVFYQQQLSQLQLFGLFFWWFSLKSWLSKEFSDLFSPVGESTGDIYLRRINDAQIRLLTGGDITKEETVFNSNARRALTELNEKAREAKEREQQLKQMKR